MLFVIVLVVVVVVVVMVVVVVVVVVVVEVVVAASSTFTFSSTSICCIDLLCVVVPFFASNHIVVSPFKIIDHILTNLISTTISNAMSITSIDMITKTKTNAIATARTITNTIDILLRLQ